MDNNYREIAITKPQDETPVVVQVEDDEPTDTETPEQVSNEVVTAPVVVQETQKPVERQSRAQKRIKELHAKNAEKDQIIEQERREKAELQKQLLQGHTSTKESFKTTLEGQIKSLNSQIASAMTSGNADLAVQLQDQLMNAKIELQSINKDLTANHQEIQRAESVANQTRTTPNQVPERALEWIEDHPEFRTDAIFNGAAIAVNNQLLKEGFDPTSDEFYAEIDSRLTEHFPKLFGVAAKSVVQYKVDANSSSTPQDVKVEAPVVQSTTKVRTVEQTVSGSSRPSANTIPQRKVTEVTLSAQDVKQAEAWGWSLERMAKRIVHIEKTKNENGYAPIQIG